MAGENLRLARRGWVPNLDLGVFAARQHVFTVRRISDGKRLAGMSLLQDDLIAGRVPDLHRAVPACRRNALSIGRKSRGSDGPRMSPQRAYLSPGRHIPELDHAVFAA